MSNNLVAYFSASGVTRKLAERLANITGADLFEIKPEAPYTMEDLDWTNKNSRSAIEMHNPSFRPPIAEKIENMEQYDVLYVGFPVWWYREPEIIDSFVESYDLTGKTIIPFCTSQTSGAGSTAENLKKLCAAKIFEGRRLDGNASAEELKKWVMSMKL